MPDPVALLAVGHQRLLRIRDVAPRTTQPQSVINALRGSLSDVQHLTYDMSGNDAFVTSRHDGILKKPAAISAATGIVILDPAEALGTARS